MPLRKAKGRRRPRAVSGPAKGLQEDTVLEENSETDKKRDAVEDTSLGKTQEETRPETLNVDDGDMDEEERRARETIALLAKKYQVISTVHEHFSL